MPGIVERIACGQHDMLPRNKGYSKFLIGIKYPYRFHGIVEHCAICERYCDCVPKVDILEHLKMIAVAVPVDDTDALFAGISGGFKPTGSLIKCFVINAD